MSVELLFFGELRETMGCARQPLELPAGVATLGALREHLFAQGGPWRALTPGRARFAVNGVLAGSLRTPVRDGDEVAVFPPVVGG